MYSATLVFIALQLVILIASASPLHFPSKRDDFQGDATYYATGTGACGYADNDNEPIVAISHLIYGDGGSCDQWIQITNPANGKSQYGRIRDECEGCAKDDVDLSPSLFQSLGEDLSVGRFTVTWHYMGKDFSP